MFINDTTLAESIFIIGIVIVFSFMMVQFNKKLQGELCRRCPNFSCAMNKTPQEIRNSYIKKNSVMKESWEKAGNQFDD